MTTTSGMSGEESSATVDSIGTTSSEGAVAVELGAPTEAVTAKLEESMGVESSIDDRVPIVDCVEEEGDGGDDRSALDRESEAER